MVNAPNILVVDDDPQICELIAEHLKKHYYQVYIAHNGQDMRRKLKSTPMDLIILDIMLPGEDGISLCKELRTESEVPIIMLSAAGEEADRVIGLEVGADDYLTKPFSLRELLARIKSLLRRSSGEIAEKRRTTFLSKTPGLTFLNWTLDLNQRKLTAPDGLVVPLSQGEYLILLAFLEHPQRALTRDQLLEITKGKEAEPFDRSIDVLIGRLRKKIEVDPKNPAIIITVRGAGYQFNATVKQAS